MRDVIIGLCLCLLAALGVLCLVMIGRSFVPKPRALERRALDGGGIELELDDGSLWRTQIGYVWHHFPSGERAYLELEGHLDREDDRLRLLNEWSEQ